MDNVANTEELSSCCCGSTNLKELKPYGVESVQCRDCHVSLLKQDWDRVMKPRTPKGFRLINIMENNDPATCPHFSLAKNGECLNYGAILKDQT